MENAKLLWEGGPENSKCTVGVLRRNEDEEWRYGPPRLHFVREGDEHVLLELKVPARSVELLRRDPAWP